MLAYRGWPQLPCRMIFSVVEMNGIPIPPFRAESLFRCEQF
jgi:hypothetical protein